MCLTAGSHHVMSLGSTVIDYHHVDAHPLVEQIQRMHIYDNEKPHLQWVSGSDCCESLQVRMGAKARAGMRVWVKSEGEGG